MAEVGLGLAALGRPGYLNLGHGDDLGRERAPEALERRTHAVLDAAYKRGVRYFDTARSYGLAERFLGSWLRGREMRPGDVFVASKWGYEYTADWQVDADPPEVKDLSLATFERQFEETRRLLSEHLVLYQIHSATIESGVLDDEPLMDALPALRSSGIEVGLTVTGPEQAATIDRAVELGHFDAVQATWNLLERSAGDALARAQEAGMRVVVKEALANGRLTDRGGVEPLLAAAAAVGAAPDALAIAAVLAQPWCDVALSGAGSVAQLESNLSARDLNVEPDVLSELTEPAAEYWDRRAALAWT